MVALPVSPDPIPRSAVEAAFAAAIRRFDRSRPVLVLGHFDADGMSAAAIFVRALQAAGWPVAWRLVGRGENPWSDAMRVELADQDLGGLIVTDLGVRPGALKLGTPTVVVDHHVPTGTPAEAVVITGHDFEPIPTSSLLAWWCAGALTDPEPLLWLAGMGLIGDMADGAGFPEMAEARRFGITALRDAVTLVNAARRSGSADASPAFRLMLRADGPKDVTVGDSPDHRLLQAARAEVRAESERVKRIAPTVRDGVALIVFDTPCQLHPLVAQQWRGRLRGEIVIAANTGYRPGWVHFAARSARDLDLIAFLAEHAPPGADEHYGSGHRQATGGALRLPDWNLFIAGLGFPEQQVPA